MKKILLLTITMMAVTIASAQIINVPADQPDIQSGIDAASDGDTVLVADGTYLENINFKGKAITVASLFFDDGDTNHINNTIIDGSQPLHIDSASVVTFRNGEDTTSILCGFTITGGTGTIFPPFLSRVGGGVCIEESGAKILHNKIIGNSIIYNTFGGGAGISFSTMAEDYWAVIEHNTIMENIVNVGLSAFGGGIIASSSSRINNNIISNNEAICTGSAKAAEGGGIYCDQYGNPDEVSLYNNIISNNTVSGDYARGGGITVYNSKINIVNNQIYNNQTLGERGIGSAICFHYTSSDILIKNNQIHHNEHNSDTLGMAVISIRNILNYDFEINISGNTIYNNFTGAANSWAPAIWLWDAYTLKVTIDGNYIHNNSGGRAGGFYSRNSYNYSLTNNVFSNNIVDYGNGGALYFHQYETKEGLRNINRSSFRSVISNNTFMGNETSGYGGAIYFTSNYDSICPIIMNNIFWENEASSGYGEDIYYWGSEDLVVEANDIDTNQIIGNWNGHGNINKDPIFIDDTCHLNCLEPSPCINAGVENVEVNGIIYEAPLTDIDGNQRPLGEYFDIGADEEALCTYISEWNIPKSLFNLRANPNPTTGIININYKLEDVKEVIISMMNIRGELLQTHIIENQTIGENSTTLDLSHLPNGLYMIRLQAGNQSETSKIIIHK